MHEVLKNATNSLKYKVSSTCSAFSDKARGKEITYNQLITNTKDENVISPNFEKKQQLNMFDQSHERPSSLLNGKLCLLLAC